MIIRGEEGLRLDLEVGECCESIHEEGMNLLLAMVDFTGSHVFIDAVVRIERKYILYVLRGPCLLLTLYPLLNIRCAPHRSDATTEDYQQGHYQTSILKNSHRLPPFC